MVPTRLTSEQRDLLERFEATSGEETYNGGGGSFFDRLRAFSGRGIRYAHAYNPYLRRLRTGAGRSTGATGRDQPRPQRPAWRERRFIEVVDGGGRLRCQVAWRRGGRHGGVGGAGWSWAGDSLYQAVPKGGRMDLVVEKATEVGATRIVPLLAERGVVTRAGGRSAAGGGWPGGGAPGLRLGVPEVSPYDSRTPSRRWKGPVSCSQCPRPPARRGRRRGSCEPLCRPGGWVERGRVAARGGGWHQFRPAPQRDRRYHRGGAYAGCVGEQGRTLGGGRERGRLHIL